MAPPVKLAGARVAPASSSLGVALERALGPGGASELDAHVPSTLWRQALAGPAAEFLARPGKELRATIVRAAWQLAGASGSPPDGLPLAIELLHAGSLVLDDIEDGAETRRGAPALHHLVGAPLAINTGSWMYFWALAELAALELEPRTQLTLLRAATTTLVRCHQGQALDLATRVGDLEPAEAPAVVAAITRLKTAALFRYATEAAALAAGAPEPVRRAIASFGEAIGTGLQMLDDLGAVASPARRDKAREDLRGARATWPWAWLAEQRPFAWARLAAIERAVVAGERAPEALADALAEAVGAIGRARIRATLHAALAELARTVGDAPAIADLAAELRRMEASYG